MFQRTVTILSKHGDTWYPRVLHDTQIARDRGYIKRTYGETSNEVVAVHIKRISGLAEGVYTVYEPKAWAALETIDANAVAFQTGDILWLGDWGMVDDQLRPIPDDTYQKGLYQWLRNTYDCTYVITNVAVFETLPHWEITGR